MREIVLRPPLRVSVSSEYAWVYVVMHQLSPWSRAFLDNLTVAQLVNKSTALYLNRKVYFRGHKKSPVSTILSQMNPVHNFPSHLFNMYLIAGEPR
jgi:hypothetical protein